MYVDMESYRVLRNAGQVRASDGHVYMYICTYIHKYMYVRRYGESGGSPEAGM